MFISTIIPTIGRPTLARAVYSVHDQKFKREACEVIVVNDSGRDLSANDWQKLPNVKTVSTNRLNRSIARNTGAAIATGRYLHFLDDDDWMLPGAFKVFWESAQNSSAAWIHGAFSMVDNNGDKIVNIYPDESGNCLINLFSWEWLPLQASLVDANAFFKVGGFAMLESLKGGFEDIHLAREIAHRYDFLNVPNLVACVRSGDKGSTTNYEDMFIQNRQSREIILDMQGTYQRLISSARDNKMCQGYWHGKIIYYLLGSAVKNMRDWRFFTAGSRLFHIPMSLFMSGKYLLRADYWHGLTKPHFPRVWLTIKDSGKDIFQNTRWNVN
ncbi:MAG: glycosyltransferase family A protein [Anaerolineales bacterium]|jgi:glycosyltransferase involved in cell wall biosynthesis